MIPDLTSYSDSRTSLMAAAEEEGAELTSYAHPLEGPAGEPLATDVARFGAPVGQAHTVVLVSSGLHGVEGHAGNGLQQLLVGSGRLGRLPEGVAVALVHAVNPFGMAWSRRVDHTNIDVNRNFVDYADLPENPRYGDVDHLLNPVEPELDLGDVSFVDDLVAWWADVGTEVAFRTISGGQYSHPGGVQFGGQAASWSRSMLERLWEEQLAGASSVVALDLHTGLGPEGRLTVFQTADESEASAGLGATWFPSYIFRSDRTGSVDHGLMGPGLDEWAAGRIETAAFVVEMGTKDPVEGVSVFRADNWLHHHGEPLSSQGETVRSRMRDFFFIADEGWRKAVADQGLDAIHAVLDGVEAGDHR